MHVIFLLCLSDSFLVLLLIADLCIPNWITLH